MPGLRSLRRVTLPPEPAMSPLRADAALGLPPAPLHGGVPPRRYGDTFSVTFLGFERPMVMISDPAAIKALYTRARARPAAGPQHLPRADPRLALAAAARRRRAPRPPQADAAALPRRADALLRADRARRSSTPRSTPGRSASEFPIHPRMQAVTLEVILRVVFGVAEGRGWSGCAACSRGCWPRPPRRRPSCVALATQPLRRRRPVGQVRGSARARSTSCSTPRSPSTARERDLEERDDILSTLMLAALRGRRAG